MCLLCLSSPKPLTISFLKIWVFYFVQKPLTLTLPLTSMAATTPPPLLFLTTAAGHTVFKGSLLFLTSQKIHRRHLPFNPKQRKDKFPQFSCYQTMKQNMIYCFPIFLTHTTPIYHNNSSLKELQTVSISLGPWLKASF